MVETEITYLGPLVAISHTGPSGTTRNFFRHKPLKADYSEEDLKHYSTSAGFKVKPVSFRKKKVVPIVEELYEEIRIGE